MVGFNITSSNNWVDVEKNSVTTRVTIPEGEYDTPEKVLLELRKAIKNAPSLRVEIRFVIESPSRILTCTYRNSSALTFKFNSNMSESIRQAIGFTSGSDIWTFSQVNGNNYRLSSPRSIPGISGSLFQPRYSGPPVPEDDIQPDNLPELFLNRSGEITQGVVREIKKYTYNFLTNDWVSPPGGEGEPPGGSDLFEFMITEGSTQIEYDTDTPLPAIIKLFPLNLDFIIELERAVVLETTVNYDDDPSWTGDIDLIRERQKDHFERLTSQGQKFEKYDGYGQVFLPVYGSRIRALDEVRHIIYRNDTPRDVHLGKYIRYFQTGRVSKIENYVNPTYSLVPKAVIVDSALQGPFLEFYENGRPQIEAQFINNFLNGPYREYYDNGLIRCQGIVLNGKLEGEYTEWDDMGNRKFKAFYLAGTLDNSYALDYSY